MMIGLSPCEPFLAHSLVVKASKAFGLVNFTFGLGLLTFDMIRQHYYTTYMVFSLDSTYISIYLSYFKLKYIGI
jgi:hypothetical protein